MNKLSTGKSVVLALLLGLMLFPVLVHAQQDTGTIVGTVFDPGGAVVPGAMVRVTNTGTNISVSVTTDNSGFFNTPPLRIGIYRMEVEVSGFKKSVRDGIALRVQDRLNLDVRLEVGEVTQTVDVTATEVLLQTQTSSVGQIMETQTIVDLPLNGRNYIQLIALTAGAFVPQPMNTIWNDQFVAINGNRAMLNSSCWTA
ncbi:MAG: carboxypeptidase-like regulatory domain-containing protein [Acidobacteria bacterium]|nr:carboxypeptidase-like regulatory domain-containing protein [Acidobacteriota bacterium]MCI0724883.1 carboxypeptidase-like regulatory domain-containing protein [Acidobacteriota bacterium]